MSPIFDLLITTKITIFNSNNQRFTFDVKSKYNLNKAEKAMIREAIGENKIVVTSAKKTFVYEN